MCDRCEENAKSINAARWAQLREQADLLVTLFKMTSDMNFGKPGCGELQQLVVYAAARALAAGLFETFGPPRRAAAEKLEAEVAARFPAMARCFVEREKAGAGAPARKPEGVR